MQTIETLTGRAEVISLKNRFGCRVLEGLKFAQEIVWLSQKREFHSSNLVGSGAESMGRRLKYFSLYFICFPVFLTFLFVWVFTAIIELSMFIGFVVENFCFCSRFADEKWNFCFYFFLIYLSANHDCASNDSFEVLHFYSVFYEFLNSENCLHQPE